MYNHHANANAAWYAALNDTPGRVGPAIDRRRRRRSASTSTTGWSATAIPSGRSGRTSARWWAIRHLPNVLLVHFADLKADMPGQIRRIADFLDIAVAEDRWPAIVEHCSFDYMKRNAAKSAPLGGAFWDGGAETFIHKGTNGRWRDVLSRPSASTTSASRSSSSAPTAPGGWPGAPAPRRSARRPEMAPSAGPPRPANAVLAAARWQAAPRPRPGAVGRSRVRPRLGNPARRRDLRRRPFGGLGL